MTGFAMLECRGRRLGYARVSTADQKLRMQIDALEAAGCDALFRDHGISGSRADRPGLDALLGTVSSGDMVVVFKLDRLGRSVLHLADLLVRFRESEVHFCSLSEGINTATPGGKLVYHVFSAFAEFQRDVIIENTREGLEATRRRGTRLGRPPKLGEEDVLEAYNRITCEQAEFDALATEFGVAPITLMRAVARLDKGDFVP